MIFSTKLCKTLKLFMILVFKLSLLINHLKQFIYRDPDVLPYDHNIVKLKSPIRDCRYINASKISPPYVRSRLGTLSRSSLARSKIPSTTSFIISQGPLPNTCVHHLQMILEQKIDVVVMLTKLEEPAHEGKQQRFHFVP